MPNDIKIPSRKNWYIREGTVNPRLQLDQLVQMYIGYMFDRTIRMFEYQNLPEPITYKDMEKFTQMQGQSFFIKHEGKPYILYGSFFDYVTWNCEPKKALIRNPALPNLKNEYIIDKDCVVYPNDSHYIGLYPMFETNAIQLASTDISLTFASFNTRLKKIFTANDDNTKASIDVLLDDIYNGREITSIVTDDLYKSSVESVDYNTAQSNDIKDLIELKQYIKANWYMDLGINANYNMKREAINENEATLNEDALIPLIDDMLECRKKAIEKINNMFGYNISIDFSSSWKKLKKEIEMKEQLQEKQAEMLEDSNVEAKKDGEDNVPDETKSGE